MDKRVWLIILCAFHFFLKAQSDHGIKPKYSKDTVKEQTLVERIKANSSLAFTDAELSFRNIEKMMDEALENEDHLAQLMLYEAYCWYFNRIMDVDNLFKTANEMTKKAKSLGNLKYEVASYIYLSLAYSQNEMFDKAFKELNKVASVAKKMDLNEEETVSFNINHNIYTSIVYQNQKKYKEALKHQFYALKESENIEKKDKKKYWERVIYSNISSGYLSCNKLDSAEYYVNQSIALKDPDKQDYGTMCYNYTVLGEINKRKEKYPEAAKFYLLAEQLISKSGNFEMQKAIYEGLIEVYESAHNTERLLVYHQKLKDMQIELEKSKNRSLHNIIYKSEQEQTYKDYYMIAGFTVLGVVLLWLLYNYRKKNKRLEYQEQQSREYLQEPQALPIQEKSYDELIEMIKKNDPAFLASFYEKFPDFLNNIQTVNPKITQSEVEFCTLLKLNLSTKEIAQLKNLEVRTVQNKKYIIRKKLNIPRETDIYYWFSTH